MKADRRTAGGLVDPLGDAKDSAERRLLRLIKERLNGQYEQVVKLLGDPPDLANLTQEFWATEMGKMLSVVRPEIEALALQAGEQVIAAGVGVAWDLVAEQAAEWAANHAGTMIAGVTETTRTQVGKVVERYFREAGATTGDLARSLEPWFSPTRAEAIAVTEVTTAAAEGGRAAAQAAEAAGYTMDPVWHTNRDELVCAICGPNDGKRKSEGWTVEGIPAHTRCRCWQTYKVGRA